MFILLGTDLHRRRRPIVTETLIVLMMVAYLAVLVIGSFDEARGLEAIQLMELSSADFHWWQLITYQFAHDNPLLPGEEHPLLRLLHIGLNLMCLWVFGSAVEDKMQRSSFAVFALMGGAVAGAAHALSSPVPVIGASGMVGALAGAFLVLAPRCHVRVLVIFILIRIWMVPALWIIAFWVIMDLAGWAGLGGSNVAYTAHLGGYAWGIALTLVLLYTPVIARTQTDAVFLLGQWRRRRAYRATVTEPPRAGSSPQQPLQSAFVGEVRAAIRRGDMTTAADRWKRGVNDCPEATLPAADQLAIANHLQVSGDRPAAADAYRRYLARYGDAQAAGEVRLLLAVLLVRSLDAATEAVPLLEQALADGLGGQRRDLAEALLREASLREATAGEPST
ncbi:MAG: rhomboid family intramembrane serine protease [Phycisphaerales bacterium]|jgi:membrane associated rhomboid family serine protease|nr:rhomboid family intramembrane serine protease [Phycisphaerales bacterium]